MQKQSPTIDKSKPYYELQSFNCTLDMCQGFNSIKKAFSLCTGNSRNYSVWKIQAGFRYPVPLTVMQ